VISRTARAAVLGGCALVASCDYLRSFEAVCEKRLGSGGVTVEAAPMSYRTDFSLSSTQLTAKGAPSAGRVTLGYIETQLRSGVSFAGNGVVHPVTRRYCVRPEVRVKIAFEPTTLYVAREQPEGSCEFRITLDHELQHFREYERYLGELGERIDADLKAEFGNRIFYFDSVAAGQKQLDDMARVHVRRYVESGFAEVSARQAKYDTPEEYFRLERFQAACGS
jgi:hypothetical protein